MKRLIFVILRCMRQNAHTLNESNLLNLFLDDSLQRPHRFVEPKYKDNIRNQKK